MKRRDFVKIAGATLAVETTGCVLDDSSEEDPNDLYLAGANDYNGFRDMTGKSEVTVDVGAGRTGLAFDPVAIEISPGTTVVWEWTGEGGAHNVVAENRTFNSGSAESSSNITFEHSFNETDEFWYFCGRHKAIGMRGVIRVTES